MSIKPILFNTEMVQAILEWRKTVTRRIAKLPKGIEPEPDGRVICSCEGGTAYFDDIGQFLNYFKWSKYKPGDILWVRETFSLVNVRPIRYLYKCFCPEAEGLPVRWRPSIHMPKVAARLFLRVTAVRVERLQEITPEDCVREGAVAKPHYMKWGGEKCLAIHSRYRRDFKNLWNSTIKSAYLPRRGWDANPWVWVIEFERCERPEGWDTYAKRTI